MLHSELRPGKYCIAIKELVKSHDVFQETVLGADSLLKQTCERMLAEGDT